MALPDWIPASTRSASYSEAELVVPFDMAIDTLNQAKQHDSKLLGWEGWLLYPNGQKGHSRRFQGIDSLESQSMESAIDLCLVTIKQAKSEWDKAPEIIDGKLLFCITFG